MPGDRKEEPTSQTVYVRNGRTKHAAVRTMLLVVFLFPGCSGIGPLTVDRDRFDYIAAISESWKRQTLFNLLKIRYMDAPVFMDVSSVINQYVLESEIEVGFSWQAINSQSLGGRGTYIERPTITYDPVMGEDFAREFLMPIPIPAILILVQSGYPIEHVMWLCAQKINGIENGRASAFAAREADSEFYELLDLLQGLQTIDVMALRRRLMNNKETLVMLFKQTKNEAAAGALRRVMELLDLDAGTKEFPVVHGALAVDKQEIAILTRSIMQIMIEYASYIDVPLSDISDGRVYAGKREGAETEERFSRLIRVHNSTSKPDNAHVAVRYRNNWFWIDDRDIKSKAMFNFLMILFSFTESSKNAQPAPVITVPTN